MTTSTKKFNFYNFDLDYVGEATVKNTLSVAHAENVDITSATIKPLAKFSDYFEANFEAEDLESIREQNLDILGSLIFVYPYEFFDESGYKTRYFALSSDLNLYELNAETLELTSLTIGFDTFPLVFEDNEKLYFKTSEKLVYFEGDAVAVYVTDFFDLRCTSQFKNYRFFVTDDERFSLFYGEDTEIENLGSDTSLYDELKLSPNDGEVLFLAKIGGYLYAVQQYAVSKITYSSSTFSVLSIFPLSSKVIDTSIAQFDDYIVFCTGSGAYLFDGSNLKSVFSAFTKNIDLSDVESCVYNEKYYLNCTLKIGETSKRIIAELNTVTQKCNIYNQGEVARIYSIKSPNIYQLVAVVSSGEEYQILKLCEGETSGDSSKLKFNKFILDDSETKYLSDFSAVSSGAYRVTISSNFGSKVFDVSGSINLKNLGLKGDYFQIEISSESDFNIEALSFSLRCITEKL